MAMIWTFDTYILNSALSNHVHIDKLPEIHLSVTSRHGVIVTEAECN